MSCIIKHCDTCKAVNCKTRLNNAQNTMQAVVSHLNICNCTQCGNFTESGIYGIAVDIGTTTIALELIYLNDGETYASHSLLNSQRTFGADVISRIEASNRGNSQILKALLQKDIIEGIKVLCKKAKISIDKIKKMAVSANTVMLHLLLGYDCSGLGIYPFKTVNINTITSNFKEIFKSELLNCQVIILPSISAYIGADIVSGIFMCNIQENKDISLLIDIGTNGEMALGNKEKIICTSASAGPALEGGNISCGTGAVDGAVSDVKYDKLSNSFIFKTINDHAPVGICGSGIIDILAELVNNNFIDDTGLLKEEYFNCGIKITDRLYLTQQDIRQLQLAKSAIRTGILILADEYGIDEKDIKNVYIAGGFGYYMNIKNACTIGLIPSCFESKSLSVGNSSLGGAKRYLLDSSSVKSLEHIVNISSELYLAENKNFNDIYIKELNFNNIK